LVIGHLFAYLVGLVVGDGCLLSGQSKAVSITPGEDVTPLVPLLEKLRLSWWYGHDKTELLLGNYAWHAMKALGLPVGKKGAHLRIPELVAKSPASVIYAFLAGLTDSDSHLAKDRPRLRFVTDAPALAEDLLGILSYLGYAPRLGRSHWSRGDKRGTSYQVAVVGEDLSHLLANMAPFIHFKKIPTKAGRRKNLRWVRSVKTSQFNGYLYDLTTETENYLAGRQGMVFVHNTHVQTTISGRPFQSIHGLLKGVAVDAEVAAFKVLGGGIGMGMTSFILRGIADAVEWGADIISMSLGGPEEDPGNPYDRLISALSKEGMIFCVAAGNSGPDPETIGTPGSCEAALTVGAVDIKGNIAAFSSRGRTKDGRIKPDVVAPGVNILSSTAGLIALMQLLDGPKLGAISGTSMSTPHCAGVVALAQQYCLQKRGRKLTTDEVKEAMALYGDRAGAKDNSYGWGLLTYSVLKRYVDEKLS